MRSAPAGAAAAAAVPSGRERRCGTGSRDVSSGGGPARAAGDPRTAVRGRMSGHRRIAPNAIGRECRAEPGGRARPAPGRNRPRGSRGSVPVSPPQAAHGPRVGRLLPAPPLPDAGAKSRVDAGEGPAGRDWHPSWRGRGACVFSGRRVTPARASQCSVRGFYIGDAWPSPPRVRRTAPGAGRASGGRCGAGWSPGLLPGPGGGHRAFRATRQGIPVRRDPARAVAEKRRETLRYGRRGGGTRS